MHPGPVARQSSSSPENGCCGSLEAHPLLQGPAAGPDCQHEHAAGSVQGRLVRSLVAELIVAVVVQAGVVAAVPAAVGSVIAARH